VFAIATGVALVTVTSAFKEAPKAKAGDPTEYYFIFNGSNGQEADESQWSPIDETTYDLTDCPNQFRGCALRTTTVTGTGANMHPAQVDVTGSGTNISPVTGDGVDQVKNRNTSY